MIRLFLSVLLVMFAVVASAQVPTPNDNAVRANTDGNVTRFGSVPNTSPWGWGQIGVPMSAVPVKVYLDAPAASDDDYWVALVTTGTTAKTYTLLNSGYAPVEETAPGGLPIRYPRNAIATMSGNTTSTVTLVGFDQFGFKQTEALSYVNETGVKTGVVAWTQITSVSTGVTSTARNLKIGFGNTFGVGATMYDTLNSGARFDTDGVGLPNTTDAATFTPGAPAQFANLTSAQKIAAQNGTAAYNSDRYGTVAFANAPDGVNDYVITFFSSNLLGNGQGNYYR
jgi:hypothetical protein